MRATTRSGKAVRAFLLAAIVLRLTHSAVSAACVGDCGGDGEVTVEELITGVNIALGLAPVTSCGVFDASGDGEVTVDEIIVGVNAALVGCPPEPPTATPTVPEPSATATPQPSATSTPTTTAADTPEPSVTSTSGTASATPTGPTPTATATPEPFGRAVAGQAAVIGNGLGAFAPLVTGIIAGLQNGDTTTRSCPGGGQVELACTGTSNVTITISFTGCTVATPTGTLSFDSGTIVLRGPGMCPNLVVAAPSIDESVNVAATVRDGEGQATLLINANLTGSVTAIAASPGSMCFLTAGTVFLNGSINALMPNGHGSLVQFDNTMVSFDIQNFNASCVPIRYALTFNGNESVQEALSGAPFNAMLSNVVTTQDGTVSPPETSLSGEIDSSCFGGTVSLETVLPLISDVGDICYAGGRLAVTRGSQTQRLVFRNGGGLDIDADSDGTIDATYGSCLVAELLACVP